MSILTNEELVVAIDRALEITQKTGPNTPEYKAAGDHFKALRISAGAR